MNTEELSDKLTRWIRDRVLSAGLKGVVLGLSGGLDSSVLAVLCQRAFPKETLGLIMPCYSSEQDLRHAKEVASKLSVPARTVALEGVFDAMIEILPDDKKPATRRIAEANLKARLRMLTLYYFANRLNYAVAGSGNKSELALGYFTKYGDGGVDILPLGNLLKGQVRELASFLGISQEIIDKPPSAGLWVGQTDEGELGLRYEELDRYLAYGEATDELKKRIEVMMAKSSHKRRPPEVADF